MVPARGSAVLLSFSSLSEKEIRRGIRLFARVIPPGRRAAHPMQPHRLAAAVATPSWH